MKQTQVAVLSISNILSITVNLVICMAVASATDEFTTKNKYSDSATIFVFVEKHKLGSIRDTYNLYVIIRSHNGLRNKEITSDFSWLRVKRSEVPPIASKKGIRTSIISTRKPNLKRRRKKFFVPVICG